MEKLLVLLVVPLAALAAPQVGFGDASDQEIAEIRAGSYLETVDDNPQYNFQYKVADDKEQTYIAMDEERAGDTVSGTYSYVDPLGSLIVVTYTAGPMGYQETREVKENFVTIRARPARTQSVNGVAVAEAQRLEAQRLQSQRLEAQRLETQRLETQRLEAQRLEAQRLEAQRLEAQRLEAQRLDAQRLEAQRLEAQRLEAQRLEAQRLEAQRLAQAEAAAEAQRIEDARNALLEAQRIEAARLEAEAAAAANSQSNIISQIVAQIQPLVSQTVSSAVSGSRFPSGGRPVTRVRVPARIPAPQPVVQTSASSDLVNVFGQDGDFNVRLNHLGIEY
jgi:hypothetical protein